MVVVLPPLDPLAAPDGVHLRRATIDDLAALVALENATFAVERISARQWRHHVESASAELFVAVRNRHLVGAFLLLLRRSSRVARLYSIAVADGERGHGVGELLLRTAEHAALRRGCRALRLEVRKDNTAAQRFYEQRGYCCFAKHARYYEDGADACRYEKTLEPNEHVNGAQPLAPSPR